jgi:hypothetical protein
MLVSKGLKNKINQAANPTLLIANLRKLTIVMTSSGFVLWIFYGAQLLQAAKIIISTDIIMHEIAIKSLKYYFRTMKNIL